MSHRDSCTGAVTPAGFLSWNEQANDFDVMTLQDVLEPWISERMKSVKN
jgi:hypothetical protein